jgi:uncharacterized protein YndB with AHSA1/START domain
MIEIYHCLEINAPLKKVYWAVTEKEGLSGWWTKSLDADNKAGSVSTFRFKSGAFNKMKIMNISPDKIEWECIDGHSEWIGTKITFNLRKYREQTRVCFSHYNWKTQSEYTGECSFHWAQYLVSLKKLCETGSGMPDEGVK